MWSAMRHHGVFSLEHEQNVSQQEAWLATEKQVGTLRSEKTDELVPWENSESIKGWASRPGSII